MTEQTEKNVRKEQVESMLECLKNYKPFNELLSKHQERIARRIERGCHNANITKSLANHTPNYWDHEPFVEQYGTICYNVKVNLDPNSSINCNSQYGDYLASGVYHHAIFQYILKGNMPDTLFDVIPAEVLGHIFDQMPTIDPMSIGDLNSLEMNPNISRKFIEEIALRGNQNIKKKWTSVYPCPNYGHRQATYREVQTRSGDEGSTLFLTCLVCGDRWRKYD